MTLAQVPILCRHTHAIVAQTHDVITHVYYSDGITADLVVLHGAKGRAEGAVFAPPHATVAAACVNGDAVSVKGVLLAHAVIDECKTGAETLICYVQWMEWVRKMYFRSHPIIKCLTELVHHCICNSEFNPQCT